MLYLSLLTGDTIYADRLSQNFGLRHGTEITLLAFLSLEQWASSASHQTDVLLAEPELCAPEQIPEGMPFAYLTDDNHVEKINQISAICKYQKAEMIYKAVLSLAASAPASGFQIGWSEGQHVPVISFLGAAGGVGTTTVSVAAAKELAAMGRKVLYLSLDPYAYFDDLLSGDGVQTMSDLFYAIKSNQKLLPAKLEGAARRDRSGACFFAPFAEPMDLAGVSREDIGLLLAGIGHTQIFDTVIIDCGAGYTPHVKEVVQASQLSVVVCDGTEEANEKLNRLLKLYKRLEEVEIPKLMNRFAVVYNRFGSRGVHCDTVVPLKQIGTFTRYEGATRVQVCAQLVQKALFAALAQKDEPV